MLSILVIKQSISGPEWILTLCAAEWKALNMNFRMSSYVTCFFWVWCFTAYSACPDIVGIASKAFGPLLSEAFDRKDSSCWTCDFPKLSAYSVDTKSLHRFVGWFSPSLSWFLETYSNPNPRSTSTDQPLDLWTKNSPWNQPRIGHRLLWRASIWSKT